MGSHNLSEDIVVEILCRLPQKSLARFKCVSKHWLVLIADRTRVFPKTSHVGLVCQTFLPLHYRHNKDSTHCISQTNFLHVDNMGNASYARPPHHLNHDNFFIINSSGGFLLYSQERRTRAILDLVVFHPATNRSWNHSVLVKNRGMHFGLASDGHHFKFSHFQSCSKKEYTGCGRKFILDVFSSENEEWIQKECYLLYDTLPRIGNQSIESAKSVFLNGYFHWIWAQYLVIYHIEKGDCRFLKFPPLPMHNGGRMKRQDQCIWESEGRVNYCLVSASGGRIGIWTLLRRECSERKSGYSFGWQPKHWGVLAPPPSVLKIKHLNDFSPFAFNDDFKIVYLICRNRILSYSLETKETKEACASPFEGSHPHALCIAFPFAFHTQYNNAITEIGDRELCNQFSHQVGKRVSGAS